LRALFFLAGRLGGRPDFDCALTALGGVRRGYDRDSYENEMRNTFERLAALIERITHPPGDNVVVLTGLTG
jgi:hypothetical protein